MKRCPKCNFYKRIQRGQSFCEDCLIREYNKRKEVKKMDEEKDTPVEEETTDEELEEALKEV